MALRRAHSLFEIKSIDDEQRIVEGYTSTPAPDRGGDVLDPKGASFDLPLPLLWQHQHDQPIGHVIDARVSAKGIWIKAQIAKDVLPYIDDAWKLIRAGLVRGFSVGWKPLEAPLVKDGLFHYGKWLWAETSTVTIPMNGQASIALIKSLDAECLAASGTDISDPVEPAGVTALPVSYGRKAQTMDKKSYAEQIQDLSNKRAAHEAQRVAVQDKATNEGRTKDEAEQEEFTTLGLEMKRMDAELRDLRELEASNIEKAVVVQATTPAQASDSRVASQRISVRPNVEKGASFSRMCMALAAGGGDSYKTLQFAKQWNDSTPEVEDMIQHMWRTKTAVAAGTTTDSTWAGPLAVRQPLNDFLELLRARELISRISGFKQVPFNISIPTQTTGGTYGWVGQNKPKPVTKADYLAVTLDFNKIAGIIVLSEELVMLSTPSAERLVREEMLAGMTAFSDQQLVDPAVAVSAGINPASITNGAATIASSGVTGSAAKIDLASRVAVFVAANYNLGDSAWLMNEANAFGIGMSVNSLGQPLFPGFNGTGGGKLMGIDTVVSNNVGARVVLVHKPSVLFADEGGVRIDVSKEASVQMDTAPTDTVDATTVYLSLWQRNLIGLKAERIITWKLARATAVTYITTASPYIGT